MKLALPQWHGGSPCPSPRQWKELLQSPSSHGADGCCNGLGDVVRFPGEIIDLGLAPSLVADELDQEGVAASRLGCAPDLLVMDPDSGLPERVLVGALNFVDGRGMQGDPFCPAGTWRLPRSAGPKPPPGAQRKSDLSAGRRE